ncbi:MAG: sulfatase [Candidatus Hinthialibacter antarcticus]|nr:sulfatase [Candidatus Hinthialibacter antarcticus]
MAINQMRRTFIKQSLAASAALCSPALFAAETKRPNLVFILTDDQRFDMLGCMGNPVIQTPTIDALASRGALFTNNFCTTSICMSSRASILTGLYERSHAITDFSKPMPNEKFRWSYPALLRKSGYYTAFIGKWGLGGALPESEFDFFNGFPGQGKYEHVVDGKPRHLTSMIGDDAVDFISNASQEKPLCLAISTKAPHVLDSQPNPFRSDPAYDDLYKYDVILKPETGTPDHFKKLPKFLQAEHTEGVMRWKRRFSTNALYQENVKDYYRLITGVDRTVGRVMEALKKQGLADNTVIIFTSDNGFFLGEKGLAGKWLMYEESIRTPLLIFDPRKPKQQRIEAMSLNIDIMPTLLDYAGVEIPSFVQGRSLKQLVHNPKSPWRKDWFYEHAYTHKGRIADTMGVRFNNWKYTRYVSDEYEEVFDLSRDPQESHNLALKNDTLLLKAGRKRTQQWTDALTDWRHDPGYQWQDPA